MVFVDIVKVREAEAKLKKFGFVRIGSLEHPDMRVPGSIWGHPQTKARVNLYPDGSSDRETDILRTGWINPVMVQAKAAVVAAEKQAWENLARIGEKIMDTGFQTTDQMLDVLDRNLKVINRAEKLRKAYNI